jgi:hypothetical protein
MRETVISVDLVFWGESLRNWRLRVSKSVDQSISLLEKDPNATYQAEPLVHTVLEHLSVGFVLGWVAEPSLVPTCIPRVEVTADFFVTGVYVRHVDAYIAVDHLLIAVFLRLGIALVAHAECLA